MYKKIVVGYDGSAFGDAALAEAIRLARDTDGQIAVVRAVEISYEMEVMTPELDRKFVEKATEELRQAEKKVRVAGVGLLQGQGVSAEAPYEAIVGAARRLGSDLIVVGTHGRTGFMRLLMGSTAERVIGNAPCNVLVVHAP